MIGLLSAHVKVHDWRVTRGVAFVNAELMTAITLFQQGYL